MDLRMFSIQIFGINQEFSEESFMPNMEMAEASEEISEKFTSIGSISILVKSKNKDVLTTDDLVEILQIEKKVISKLTNENTDKNTDSYISVNSVADIIAQTALFPTGNTNPTIDEKIVVIQNMNDDEIKQTVIGLFTSDQTSPEI